MTAPVTYRLADVQSGTVGAGIPISQFVVVLPGARIGQDTTIGAHRLLECDVVMGGRVTLRRGVQLRDGLGAENAAVIGPNVSRPNDRFPRSRQKPERLVVTAVDEGACVGAGAVVVPALEIGRNAMLADDGTHRQEFLLDGPDLAIHLMPRVWDTRYPYSADAVLLVSASDDYDRVDCIRDYSEFRQLAGVN